MVGESERLAVEHTPTIEVTPEGVIVEYSNEAHVETVGRPCETWGDVMAALNSLDAEYTPEALEAHRRLGDYV